MLTYTFFFIDKTTVKLCVILKVYARLAVLSFTDTYSTKTSEETGIPECGMCHLYYGLGHRPILTY
jgi:hypothetical protein